MKELLFLILGINIGSILMIALFCFMFYKRILNISYRKEEKRNEE